MRDWLNYWRAVLIRAWQETRKRVFPDTLMKVTRDLLFFLVATGVAFAARQPLADLGTITRADNPVLDNTLPFVFGACAVIICFAAYYLVEALLVSPFRVYATLEEKIPAAGGQEVGPTVHHPQTASYKLWDGIDPLELYQAACLWIGLAPPDSSETPLTGDASVSLYKLTRAIENEELEYSTSHMSQMEMMTIRLQISTSQRFKAPKSTRVTRKALMIYAATIGERPAFLYPEVRLRVS